ncbi:MAG TPA: VanZ family protein [Albitalea sp.]|nr:VanZ family protein [Albitalea sp.]
MRGFWPGLLTLCGLLITYGSLYPFHFVAPPSGAAAWSEFISNVELWTSIGDMIGNVLLFVPFGALIVAALPREKRGVARLCASAVLSIVFAFAIQAFQIYFPPRAPALADVFWNGAGTVIGIGVALALATRAGDSPWQADRVPVILVLVWIVTQWWPFVPTLDWQGIKDSLKPLLLHPDFHLQHALLTTVRTFIVGCLFGAMTPYAGRNARRFAALLCIVLAGKVLTVGQVIDVSTLSGYVAGFAIWFATRSARRAQLRAGLVVLFVAYTVSALTPLEIRGAPSEFHWMPFQAMLEGSMEINSMALLESSLVYAALLWLVDQMGGRVRDASFALALWVGCLECAQMWIDGRTADITPVLLALAAGEIIHWLSAPSAPAARRRARA